MSEQEKPFFIYPKDKDGKLLKQTHCVIHRQGRAFHGVAICAPDDEFVKSVGRSLSLERAEQAFNDWEQATRGRQEKQPKEKVLVAHYNAVNGHPMLGLKSKVIANTSTNKHFEIWASEKDPIWNEVDLSSRFVSSKDNGDNILIEFAKGESILLNYGEIAQLQMLLFVMNKYEDEIDKFNPKRLK